MLDCWSIFSVLERIVGLRTVVCCVGLFSGRIPQHPARGRCVEGELRNCEIIVTARSTPPGIGDFGELYRCDSAADPLPVF